MSDVFISQAREDRAFGERLGEALRCLGLDVSWDTSPDQQSHIADQIDQAIQASAASVVLWSRSSASSGSIKAEALRAHSLAPLQGSYLSNRYCGLILDDLSVDDLPSPFNELEITRWSDWFSAREIDYDDPRLLELVKTVEGLTGRKQLIATARAIALRDAEVVRLRAQISAQESSEQSERAELESKLKAHAADLQERINALAERDALLRELTDNRDTLTAELRSLSATLDAAKAELQEANKSVDEQRAALNQTEASLRSSEAARASLDAQLEDARSGLEVALRQQAALRSDIHAADENLRIAVLERESLRDALQTIEHKKTKLTAQLSDAVVRLAETDQQRQTYESALVARKREIDQLTDEAAAASQEIGLLNPRVEQLSQTIKSWGHVPWRSIAAGSLAAGVVATSGAFSIGQAVSEWYSKPTQQLATTSPAAPVATPLVETQPPLSIPPKSDAQIEPDTLQIVERGPQDDDPSSAPSEAGVIAIPDESAVPAPNDQVQFNPDGLPPVDPDTRPPPQDLPPMQQKPRLLLKPPAPPATQP